MTDQRLGSERDLAFPCLSRSRQAYEVDPDVPILNHQRYDQGGMKRNQSAVAGSSDVAFGREHILGFPSDEWPAKPGNVSYIHNIWQTRAED
jgi:hypothetical protein